MNPANFSELRNHIDTWDISAEQSLIEKMKIFTLNYNEEFQQFCKNMDNLDNCIESIEVEHLKAINQLKTLSRERFVENTLDNEESESEANEDIIKDGQSGIQITKEEEKKIAIDLSLKCLNQIKKKNKNVEEIEDDAVSVVSKRITIDNKVKVRLPFIIGTEEFKAEKTIGLDVAREKDDDEDEKDKNEEEEDEVDSDDNIVDYIPVSKKQREKWEEIERKKKNSDVPKIEEPEVKVPIENEGDNQNVVSNSENIAVIAADPAKSGGAIPPPPPPPPPPPVLNNPVTSKS